MNRLANLPRRALALALGAVIVAALGLTALTQPRPANAQISFPPPPDGCLTADPDAMFYVLNTFSGSTASKSESGAYAYKSKYAGSNLLAGTCDYWVLDVKMATYSPKVTINGNAYDLPSSSAFGGTIPTTQEDCNRFRLYKKFYRKLGTESAFTSLGSSFFKGQWASGSCSLVKTSGTTESIDAGPSSGQGGWDTYRVAVRATLRSSGQEVRATVSEVPPVPK